MDGVLGILLAPACAACRMPLDSPIMGPVCSGCWGAIRPLTPPYCCVCGDPLRSWRTEPGVRCAMCRARGTPITVGRTVGEYDGALRRILHALKYDGRRTIAPVLSSMMRQHGRAVLSGADFVVPVPLHWRRYWQRGFNQAAALAADLGLPVVAALTRVRVTRTQTDLPAAERQANVKHAFRPRQTPGLHRACIVLVDDVSTTGATLDACARALIDGGAREVRTLTAARVLTQPPGARPP